VQPRIIAPAPVFVAPAPIVVPVPAPIAQAPIVIPVPVPAQAPVAAPVAVPAPVQEGQECPICGEAGDMFRLACEHQTCRDCLQHMLANAVQEHSTRSLRCSDPDCRQSFSPADIAQMTDDQALLNNISDLFFQEFAAQDPHIRHCPTADCPYMYSYEGNPDQVTCPTCHQSYCSNCRVNHPVGVACDQAEHQNHGVAADHAAEEAATEQLIHNTTKSCPRCHAAIEKNEGCNHMTCSNCGYEFCWLCSIRWPGIGGHPCPLHGEQELAHAVAHDGQFAAQVAEEDDQGYGGLVYGIPANVYAPAYGWIHGGPRGLFNAW
jgi:hypothetical protein